MVKSNEEVEQAPPYSVSENIVSSLRRLHREYLAAVREMGLEGERRINAALQKCMSELAKIEDESAVVLRQASSDYAAAERAATDSGTPSPHYWDYQKKVTDVRSAARERADGARKEYLDGWKAVENGLAEPATKAKLDYIGRIQATWKAIDISKIDAPTADVLIQAMDFAFADVSVA